MGQFLYIQQFNGPLDLQDGLQNALRGMGYSLLSNGQSFMQFGQGAYFSDRKNDSFLLDIFPKNDISGLETLQHSSAEFSGVYLHKKKFSADLFRDYFGVKCLFYSFLDNRLVASNDLRSVLACQMSKPKVCRDKVIRYFDPRTEELPTDELTFFEGIKRVLPGQRLFFQAGKTASFHFANINFKDFEQKGESPRAFREVLINNTLERALASGSVSANLSGGLDSSSLSAILGKFSKSKVKGLFFDTEMSASFEWKHAQAVAESYQFPLERLRHKKEYYAQAKKLCGLTAKPETLIIPSSVFSTIFQSASAHGSILFSGQGGDNVVGFGHSHVKQLFAQGKHKKAFEAIGQKFDRLDEMKQKSFGEYLWGQSLMLYPGSRIVIILQLLLAKQVSLSFVWEKWKAKLENKKNRQEKPGILHLGDTDKEHQGVLFYKELNRHFTQQQKQFAQANQVALSNDAHETFDCLSRHFGILSTYPLLNKDLLKIAANYPQSSNFDKGRLRGLFREAMKDILPESVRLRTQKATFGDFRLSAFKKLWSQCQNDFGEGHRVWEFVDKNIFDIYITQLLASQNSDKNCHSSLFYASKTIYFGIWLDTFSPS